MTDSAVDAQDGGRTTRRRELVQSSAGGTRQAGSYQPHCRGDVGHDGPWPWAFRRAPARAAEKKKEGTLARAARKQDPRALADARHAPQK